MWRDLCEPIFPYLWYFVQVKVLKTQIYDPLVICEDIYNNDILPHF